jgi:hypothetical protein
MTYAYPITSGNDSYEHYGTDPLSVSPSAGDDYFFTNTANAPLESDDGNDKLSYTQAGRSVSIDMINGSTSVQAIDQTFG